MTVESRPSMKKALATVMGSSMLTLGRVTDAVELTVWIRK
jgi:hypothetical protein